MRQKIAILLALTLLVAPAVPVLADVTPTAASAPSSETNTPEAVTPDQPKPPVLPEAVSGTAVEAAPQAVTTSAEPTVPSDVLAKPGDAKPEEKPSRFKFGNFALGFLGGALLGGAAGVLFSGGQGSDSMVTHAALYGGGAGLGLGLLALLLGSTTPEEAKPPKVDEGSLRPGFPGVQVALRF